jgi:hypothetical protein
MKEKKEDCQNCHWKVNFLSPISLLQLDSIYEYKREGARNSVVVKALCYKPEGRGFDSR